jgi:tRNA dimethylallyltransferase
MAQCFGIPILNFDSLLFYKELSIGTAVPPITSRGGVPHFLVQFTTISNPINAAIFVREALAVIEKYPLLFLVGGSGFYLRSLIKGMYPDGRNHYKAELLKLYQDKGIGPIYKDLQEVDAAKAAQLHINDHYRIIRAMEYYLTNRIPLSLQESNFRGNNRMDESIHPWKILNIYLDMDKDRHLQNIEQRTNKMIQNGLIEETQDLLKKFDPALRPLRSIGYLETIRYLSGHYKSIDEYKDAINTSTRQLAKCQRTWFKRDSSRVIFDSMEVKENPSRPKSLIEDFLIC